MKRSGQFKINRAAFSVGSLNDSEEKEYWLSRTTEERMQALELNRQIVYGYDPSTTRLQRILEIIKRK